MFTKLEDIAPRLASLANQKEVSIPPIENLTATQLFKLIFPYWMTFDEWEEAGKPKEKAHLYKWQQDFIVDVFQPLIDNYEKDDYHIRIAMAGAYGIGKSAMLAMIIIMHICYCYLYEKHRLYKGSVYSGSEVQLRETLWDEVRIHSSGIRGLCHECKKMFIDRPSLGDNDKSDLNFYRVTAETLNTNNVGTKRGKHAGNVLVIFDEGTNMSDEMYKIVDSFGTNCRRVWLVASNPTTTVGTFYQFFTNEFYRNKWLTKHISVFDSYPEGHTYALECIEKYGEDSDDVRVSVYGQFPQSSVGAIFPQILIDQAMSRALIPQGDLCALGIDLATERGRDFSAIAIKRPLCYQNVTKYKMPLIDFIKNVVYEHILQFNPVFVAIDRGGIGEMAVQELAVFCQTRGVRLIPVDFGGRPEQDRFLNRRTELLFKLKDRLMDSYALCPNQELREEMSWLTYGSEYGKIKAVSKKDLPKSTDLLDAVAMTEAADMVTPGMAQYIQQRQKEKEAIARRERQIWGTR